MSENECGQKSPADGGKRGNRFSPIANAILTEAGGKQAMEQTPAHETPARFSGVAGHPL